MPDFPEAEIYRLPYVDHVPADGRSVSIQVPYFDDASGDWHLYFRPKAGVIGRMAGGEPVYGSYFGRRAADAQRDLESPISSLVAQRLSFPGLPSVVAKFQHDVHNCAAVLEKFHLIASRDNPSEVARVLIVTEIEYLLTLLRSMYDHLHGLVRDFLPLIVDDNAQRVAKKTLPDSFRRIALDGETLRDGDAIVAKYDLPAPLANWYVGEGAAFKVLRLLRDGVVHHGKSIPEVYRLDDYGLAVAKDRPPWNDFAIWTQTEPVNERLVPLRLAFAALVKQLLDAGDRLVPAITNAAPLPTAIGTDIRTYLRSAVSHRLLQIPAMMRQPWEQRDR
jgi:hypothetical protein